MEHRNIPNDGLHEPKDIVFATSGQVYVADGAGSGTWREAPIQGLGTALSGQTFVSDGAGGGSWAYPSGGWAIYEDTGTPLVVTPVETPLTIDGEGAGTNETQRPKGAQGPLWVDDSFVPVNFSDVYAIEIEVEVDSVTGADTLTLRLNGFSQDFQATPGLKVAQIPTHIFLGDPEPDVEILMSCNAGSVDITGRKVKIVQLYGA